MRPDVGSLSVHGSATLETALKAIDASGAGVAFIVNQAGVLEGLLTDGDIRRAMLHGASLGDPCTGHTTPQFVVGRIDSPRSENLRLMSSRILVLPLVDSRGRLIDYISWRDMWQVPLVSPRCRATS